MQTTCSLAKNYMEHLLITTTTLLICLFTVLLQPPSSSCAAAMQLQQLPFEEQAATQFEVQLSLPRKLRLLEEVVKSHGVEVSTLLNKHREDISGKGMKKEKINVEHGSKGTWQEWVDHHQGTEEDTSQFFTMDYSRVRRRRPIHNKSLPVGP